MSRRLGKYDPELAMFVADEPRPLNLNHLEFLRYLGEQGQLEHRVEGPASGPLVTPTEASGEAP